MPSAPDRHLWASVRGRITARYGAVDDRADRQLGERSRREVCVMCLSLGVDLCACMGGRVSLRERSTRHRCCPVNVCVMRICSRVSDGSSGMRCLIEHSRAATAGAACGVLLRGQRRCCILVRAVKSCPSAAMRTSRREDQLPWPRRLGLRSVVLNPEAPWISSCPTRCQQCSR